LLECIFPCRAEYILVVFAALPVVALPWKKELPGGEQHTLLNEYRTARCLAIKINLKLIKLYKNYF